jgi:hypothetical protein
MRRGRGRGGGGSSAPSLRCLSSIQRVETFQRRSLLVPAKHVDAEEVPGRERELKGQDEPGPSGNLSTRVRRRRRDFILSYGTHYTRTFL